MPLRCVDKVDEVPESSWDRLAGNRSPFLRHAFLAALERHGCVGAGTGWYPRHLLLEMSGELVGAVPLYLKTNSYGEFVFDWGWAHAYQRSGLEYYPKIVAAIPYTPATGPRLLVAGDDSRAEEYRHLLAAGVVAMAEQLELSSLHCLFLEPSDHKALTQEGLSTRLGCQFHWHNPGYGGFDDFLGALSSKKRKNIRRERRLVADAGLQLDTVSGADLGAEEWAVVHALYRDTFDRFGGMPTLSLPFFRETARTLPEHLLVTVVRQHRDVIAAAILWRSEDTLYGRHWGCFENHDSLHFEACYYRGIEYCIAQGLTRFEPGAQGEHKVARGFLPVLTSSSHWIADEGFRQAVQDFTQRETEVIRKYAEQMRTHSAYRSDQ